MFVNPSDSSNLPDASNSKTSDNAVDKAPQEAPRDIKTDNNKPFEYNNKPLEDREKQDLDVKDEKGVGENVSEMAKGVLAIIFSFFVASLFPFLAPFAIAAGVTFGASKIIPGLFNAASALNRKSERGGGGGGDSGRSNERERQRFVNRTQVQSVNIGSSSGLEIATSAPPTAPVEEVGDNNNKGNAGSEVSKSTADVENSTESAAAINNKDKNEKNENSNGDKDIKDPTSERGDHDSKLHSEHPEKHIINDRQDGKAVIELAELNDHHPDKLAKPGHLEEHGEHGKGGSGHEPVDKLIELATDLIHVPVELAGGLIKPNPEHNNEHEHGKDGNERNGKGFRENIKHGHVDKVEDARNENTYGKSNNELEQHAKERAVVYDDTKGAGGREVFSKKPDDFENGAGGSNLKANNYSYNSTIESNVTQVNSQELKPSSRSPEGANLQPEAVNPRQYGSVLYQNARKQLTPPSATPTFDATKRSILPKQINSPVDNKGSLIPTPLEGVKRQSGGGPSVSQNSVVKR